MFLLWNVAAKPRQYACPDDEGKGSEKGVAKGLAFTKGERYTGGDSDGGGGDGGGGTRRGRRRGILSCAPDSATAPLRGARMKPATGGTTLGITDGGATITENPTGPRGGGRKEKTARNAIYLPSSERIKDRAWIFKLIGASNGGTGCVGGGDGDGGGVLVVVVVAATATAAGGKGVKTIYCFSLSFPFFLVRVPSFYGTRNVRLTTQWKQQLHDRWSQPTDRTNERSCSEEEEEEEEVEVVVVVVEEEEEGVVKEE
ncbi:hypothetical protein M0802_007138 [Mischocyttarus mexicanus]|nr:hypothetical protein M0802_007138 [Mischocyttarus mexicanus]